MIGSIGCINETRYESGTPRSLSQKIPSLASLAKDGIREGPIHCIYYGIACSSGEPSTITRISLRNSRSNSDNTSCVGLPQAGSRQICADTMIGPTRYVTWYRPL